LDCLQLRCNLLARLIPAKAHRGAPCRHPSIHAGTYAAFMVRAQCDGKRAVTLMNDRTDVFVVGGGPSGLALAIAARLKGMNVVVADGAAPPIARTCGEGMMPETQAALRSLGVQIEPSDGIRRKGMRF